MITETLTSSSTVKGDVPPQETGTNASAGATEQLVLTTRADTGEIVKIEKIDSSGRKIELSEEQCRQLAGEDEIEEIDAALDATYEAAFVEALQDKIELESGEESDEESVLERLILFKMLGRRIGREVSALRSTLLRRLVLRRLVRRHVLRNRLEGTRS